MNFSKWTSVKTFIYILSKKGYAKSNFILCFEINSAEAVSSNLEKCLNATKLRMIFFTLGIFDILMDKSTITFHKQVAKPELLKHFIALM